ncbi:hypothetical protein NQZ68_002030 [Dissostichus eleginoides]|nr:hypothetical protein NQZ68_002030 [Dissostichus eleginoides]
MTHINPEKKWRLPGPCSDLRESLNSRKCPGSSGCREAEVKAPCQGQEQQDHDGLPLHIFFDCTPIPKCDNQAESLKQLEVHAVIQSSEKWQPSKYRPSECCCVLPAED